MADLCRCNRTWAIAVTGPAGEEMPLNHVRFWRVRWRRAVTVKLAGLDRICVVPAVLPACKDTYGFEAEFLIRTVILSERERLADIQAAARVRRV